MSFGGSVLAMILSLKNNASPRHKVFDYVKDKKRTFKRRAPLHYKKVSQKELNLIKAKIRKQSNREDNQQFLKLMLAMFVIAGLLLVGTIYHNNTVDTKNTQIVRARQEHLLHQKADKIAYNSNNLKYFLDKGQKYLDNGDYRYAKILFATARSIDLDNYEANLGYVRTYVSDCNESINSCETTRRLLTTIIEKFGETEELIELILFLN
jgi:hypothetical protein